MKPLKSPHPQNFTLYGKSLSPSHTRKDISGILMTEDPEMGGYIGDWVFGASIATRCICSVPWAFM